MPYVGKKPADIIATAVDTTTGTFSGEVDAASLDISGNIDVDGTTNLDAVDIDGAVNMATTLLVTGETTLQTHLNLGDNDIIKVGAGSDLQIYHDGSNSYIQDTGTGQLRIDTDGTDVRITKSNAEFMATFNADGAVDLYHNNVKRLETSANGIEVLNTTAGEEALVRIKASTAGNSAIAFGDTGNVNVGKIDYNHADNSFAFDTNSGERLRIDSTGRLFRGSTTDLTGICQSFFKNIHQGEGGIGIGNNDGANTTNAMIFRNSNGNIGSIQTSSSSTIFNTSSDYRLKESVSYNFDATTRLKQLKPCRFNFKTDADKTLDGFLAHEVSSIVPEAISGEKDDTKDRTNVVLSSTNVVIGFNVTEEEWTKGKTDGIYASNTTWSSTHTEIVAQQIDQSKLVPLLTKALQEQQATIEALTARIVTLENA